MTRNTPRLCATKQLYEQISCDDPELEARVGEGGAAVPMVDRERRVWEGVARQGDRITGSRVASARQEYRAHEADIKVGVLKMFESAKILRAAHYLLLTV